MMRPARAEMRIHAAAADVASFGFVDGGPHPETTALRAIEAISKFALSFPARPWSATHGAAHFGISLHRAKGVRIRRLVIAEQQSFGFQNDHDSRKP